MKKIKIDLELPKLSDNISEELLKKVWAGEIAAGLLLSFITLIIAVAA